MEKCSISIVTASIRDILNTFKHKDQPTTIHHANVHIKNMNTAGGNAWQETCSLLLQVAMIGNHAAGLLVTGASLNNTEAIR